MTEAQYDRITALIRGIEQRSLRELIAEEIFTITKQTNKTKFLNACGL